MGTEGFARNEHLTAMMLHGGDCGTEAVIAVQIDQGAILRRFGILRNNETPADLALAMREYSKSDSLKVLSRDLPIENCGVERNGAIKVDHGNVEPDNVMMEIAGMGHRQIRSDSPRGGNQKSVLC